MRREIIELKKQNTVLRTDINYKEQMKRLLNLEIVGLPEDKCENLTNIIIALGNQFGVPLEHNDIIHANRSNPQQPGPSQQPTPSPQQPEPSPQEPTPSPQEPTPSPQEPTPSPQEPTPSLQEPSPSPQPSRKKRRLNTNAQNDSLDNILKDTFAIIEKSSTSINDPCVSFFMENTILTLNHVLKMLLILLFTKRTWENIRCIDQDITHNHPLPRHP
ncbi:unnamed protein product [Parnassius apollo]|uniref:(apollo) hypothetical protein n=1 Tax=Parnassius apollo TaxID=110799 RepID=A0A8S3WFV1_PARAO|nr:unnamed protein product [Parnassius apollo]